MRKILSLVVIFSGLIGTTSVGASASPDNVKKQQTLDMKIKSLRNKTQKCDVKQIIGVVLESLNGQKNIQSESDIKSLARTILNGICFAQGGYKCPLFYAVENAFGLSGEITGNISNI